MLADLLNLFVKFFGEIVVSHRIEFVEEGLLVVDEVVCEVFGESFDFLKELGVHSQLIINIAW